MGTTKTAKPRRPRKADDEPLRLPRTTGPGLPADAIALTVLARELGVSRFRVYQWTARGLRGHVLETWRDFSRIYTSRTAYRSWLAAVERDSR